MRRTQHSCFNFVASVDARPLENIQTKFVGLSCKNMKPHVPSTTPGTGFLNIRVLFKNSYKIFKKVRIGKSKSVLVTAKSCLGPFA